MKAAQGDRIIIRGTTVESSDRHGEILEVRGADGAPPYQSGSTTATRPSCSPAAISSSNRSKTV